MSTFICERCGCIDNSACPNNYSIVLSGWDVFEDDFANKHFLCSSCTPKEYKDGTSSGRGFWHNKFPRAHWSEIGWQSILIESKKGRGDYENARSHFRGIGLIGDKKVVRREIPWKE